jgi:hypothetical protein
MFQSIIRKLEELKGCLSQIKALSDIALSDDFLDYDEKIVHNYLWTLSDAVDKAIIVNDQSLDEFIQQNS